MKNRGKQIRKLKAINFLIYFLDILEDDANKGRTLYGERHATYCMPVNSHS